MRIECGQVPVCLVALPEKTTSDHAEVRSDVDIAISGERRGVTKN
ncbi:hypothetical protein SAMN04488000_12732 [Lentzea albida]|uniref:Uncharacterized protein n=1 Tax=Lentzea albida TaxID=65499 RepID=A0A1H9X3P6_9PSEU|nr:hypothetical protein SAMN04488000_12732 [Lentzea albida]